MQVHVLLISILVHPALAGCSFLFEKEAGAIDSGVASADAPPPKLCPNPLSFGVDSNLGIDRAQAIDIDGDGLDEVLLYANSSDRSPSVYVHDGNCPLTNPWSYQQGWQPSGDPGTQVEDPLVAHAVAIVEEAQGDRRLFAIGQQGQAGMLGSYAVLFNDTDTFSIADSPVKFLREIPMHESSDTCLDAEPPYHISAGDFDNDADTRENDLIFAGHQTWIYRVLDWDIPPPWTSSCSNGVDTNNAIPDQNSGAGDRLGFMPVSTLAAGGEVIDARAKRISWIHTFATVSDPAQWVSTDFEVDGVALAKLASADDDTMDAVAWFYDGSELELYTATLNNDGAREIVITSSRVTFEDGSPIDEALVDVAGDRRLLVLTSTGLSLVEVGVVSSIKDSAGFDFEPSLFVLPNWTGTETPTVLVFNKFDGAFKCLLLSGDTFIDCEI